MTRCPLLLQQKFTTDKEPGQTRRTKITRPLNSSRSMELGLTDDFRISLQLYNLELMSELGQAAPRDRVFALFGDLRLSRPISRQLPPRQGCMRSRPRHHVGGAEQRSSAVVLER